MRQPDWKQNEYISQVWLVSTAGGEPRQLTFAKNSSVHPRWSPDSRWLAFLSKRDADEQPQIYRMFVHGGEAERLSSHSKTISGFAWAPDGEAIAFIAPIPESEPERERVETYGEYHVEDEDLVSSHLWLLRLKDRRVLRLTRGAEGHVTGLDWNHDGSQIAFEAWPSPDEGDFDRARIYVLAMADFAISPVSDEGGSTPRWSPEGSRLAYEHMGTPTFFANRSVRVVEFSGLANASEVNLAAQPQDLPDASNIFERAAFKSPAPREYTVPMDFDEDIHLICWGLDGLYGFAVQKTAVHLFRIDPQGGAVVRLTPLDPSGWAALSASFDRDFTHAAMIASDAQHYAGVVLYDLAGRSALRLTDSRDPISDWTLGTNEVFRWTSLDGTPIEGVLTKPADFDPARRYPLLVVLHGGPTWVSLQAILSGYERRYYPTQLWLARGALILQPNYRGSAGYGEAFRSLNVRNLGLGDYADVISGVDALVERGWADPARLGAMGWSQGGYISAFIATYSDRFKAVSVGAGISNWVTYYVNTDIHPFTRQYLGATPWEDMDIYRDTSPMTYLKSRQDPYTHSAR